MLVTGHPWRSTLDYEGQPENQHGVHLNLAARLSKGWGPSHCIAPGAISSALPDDGEDVDGAPHSTQQLPWLQTRVPAQRGGLPSDIAGAVLFLTSDLGAYVNGETTLVDGGLMAAAAEL